MPAAFVDYCLRIVAGAAAPTRCIKNDFVFDTPPLRIVAGGATPSRSGYGFRRVRYIGLVRNACRLQLLCTAINLKRALAFAG